MDNLDFPPPPLQKTLFLANRAVIFKLVHVNESSGFLSCDELVDLRGDFGATRSR